MADWANYRLIVIGTRNAVLAFSRGARARPAAFFQGDMLEGETQELVSDPIEHFGPELWKKKYLFQVRNRDARPYFRELSYRHEQLRFVLVYHYPNADHYAGCLIAQGRRSKEYVVTDQVIESVMAEHGIDDSDDWDDDKEWSYWEATWDIADRIEERLLGRLLERRFPVDVQPSAEGGPDTTNG